MSDGRDRKNLWEKKARREGGDFRRGYREKGKKSRRRVKRRHREEKAKGEKTEPSFPKRVLASREGKRKTLNVRPGRENEGRKKEHRFSPRRATRRNSSEGGGIYTCVGRKN